MAPHAGRLSLTLLAAGLYIGPMGILAQTSSVSCPSSFGWMNNSEGQTPCVVGAYLQAACVGPFAVNPLPNGTHYTGPHADQQNQCQCSSVTYSAISACGLCQGALIISWNDWNTNCTATSVGIFPPGIPNGTAVPQWAFQDVTVSGEFNATLAQATGDLPESIAINAQSTNSGATSTSAPASLTPVPSSTPVPSLTPAATTLTSSGSSSNTGAIAGGVVGGVVGALLIVVVAIFLFRRKKHTPISSLDGHTVHPMSPPNIGSGDALHFPTQMAQLRLYDPSDPSTFPPPDAAFSVASSGNIRSFTNYHTSNQSTHSVQDSRLSLPQV